MVVLQYFTLQYVSLMTVDIVLVVVSATVTDRFDGKLLTNIIVNYLNKLKLSTKQHGSFNLLIYFWE